jgi:translation initiation factor IF-3
VAPLAKPPVCRLMDFGKYKYQQKKRQQEARRSATQVEVKEIKLRPKTDDHDFDTKLNHVRRFLDQNNRVKVTMMFRGRERMYAEMQRKRMMEIAEQLADCAVLDVEPRLEGRNMSMMLNPKRGGSGSGSKEGREPPSAARGGEGEPVAS